jgi:hypothetical protein
MSTDTTPSPAAEMAASAPNETVATPQDESCAVFVRHALFPLRRDYASNNHRHQHHQIHPALTALDRLRGELVDKRETPFSSLFPRRVMLVRKDSGSGDMDWNGQPDVTGNGAAVEVVPDVLSVQCMECNNFLSKYKDIKAFWRSKERYDGSEESELVVCSDRVLQKDYQKSAASGKTAQTLLDERKDLPPNSLKVVEEVLAHEITKLFVIQKAEDDDTHQTAIKTQSAQTTSCEAYAKLELAAAKAAECIYEQQESEIRRGSRLGFVGFSWLPLSIQTGFQNACVKKVAREFTAKEFGNKEAKTCVDQAWKSNQ